MKKIFPILITLISSISSMEEKWVFLGDINLPDKKTTSWRILNGQLELDINTEDPISIETFSNLLKKAQKKDLPYILVGVRDENSFYHFFDGSSYLPLLATKWENPLTRQPPYAIEIFVAGNDGKLTFLYGADLETIKKNFLIEQSSEWQLKKELQISGYGHLSVANFFIQKAESINQLHYEINQKLQIIWQYAFQWLDWALKYLPPGEKHLQAQQKRDRIFKILKPKSQIINNPPSKETWKIKKSFQYPNYIKSATYNSTNHQLCILVDNKDAILIDVDCQKPPMTLSHTFGLWKPSFDPSGRYIATSTNEKTVVLSDTDGKQITTISPTNNYHEIVTFGKNHSILIAGGKNIELRNLDGSLIINRILEKEYRIKIAKFFPNNENLIFLAPFQKHGVSHKAKLWDVRNKNLITYNYIDPLKQASIHPEGTYLACTKQGNPAAYVYDLRKEGSAYLDYKTKSAKFNSHGTHLLTEYYMAHLALLWKTQTIASSIEAENYPNCSLQFNPTNLSGATFHPHENQILTRATKNIFNPENNFTIWDLEGNQLAKLPHAKTIYSAKYDKTGNYIISKHDDNIERNTGSKIVALWEKEKK